MTSLPGWVATSGGYPLDIAVERGLSVTRSRNSPTVSQRFWPGQPLATVPVLILREARAALGSRPWVGPVLDFASLSRTRSAMVESSGVERLRTAEGREMATGERTVVKGVCPLDCPDTCSMRGDGRGRRRGRPARRPGAPVHARVPLPEDDPLPRPRLQPRPAAAPAAAGRAPRARAGSSGSRWDEALGDDRRRGSARSPTSADGPQAILPYSYYGTMGKLQASSLDRRFFHRLGASMLDRTICASAGSLGYEYTVGTRPARRRPDGGRPTAGSSSTGARTRSTPTATSGA